MDTKKSDKDDMYMAGFRAGLTAAKSKNKNKDKHNAVNEKVKNGATVHQACEDGDLNRVKELVEAIPDIKTKVDERGWAPLHISSAFGHLDILKWLLISGVDLSDKTRTGYTAIHLAAMNGHVNCIMILAAMGCSISSRTIEQFTPLHLASMSGNIECVKWLLSNRAKLDATDANGRTPLDLAEEYQHDECARMLIMLGRDLKRKDSAIALLNDPNALRRNSSIEKPDVEMEEETNWLSDAEETSDVIGRGGDDRTESKRRTSVQIGRINSVSSKRNSVPVRASQLPPKQPAARRMSRQEERQVDQLVEKKRNYAEQRKKIERKNSSFLDSIRQEIDGVVEEPSF